MQQSLPRGSMRINIFHEKNNRKKLERAANQKKMVFKFVKCTWMNKSSLFPHAATVHDSVTFWQVERVCIWRMVHAFTVHSISNNKEKRQKKKKLERNTRSNDGLHKYSCLLKRMIKALGELDIRRNFIRSTICVWVEKNRKGVRNS